MNITVEARHMKINDDTRQYTEKKVGKLEKFNDQVKSVDVILDHESGHCIAEIIAHINKKPPVIAKHEHEDLLASVDLCVDKISQQLKKEKEKLKDH